MAYNDAALSEYRELVHRNEPFRCPTCPYCNGTRDATVKHTDPVRKPRSPWDFWDRVICGGSRAPVFVLGPMVDQSELPFRLLCRRYGTTLAYTPMLHARSFANSASYRERYFSTTPRAGHSLSPDGETHKESDYPLIAQFNANDPDILLSAARFVEDHCEAVDLNLGCPQDIARRGHYGSFLMEDWARVHLMLHCLAVELAVPVTAKMRVFDDVKLTVKYAEMLRDTGIALLCVHGRTRQMKGQCTGAADLQQIRRVREALGTTLPVIANGNVYTAGDVAANLRETGADGYMCAEPLLWDPRLFAAPERPLRSGRTFAEPRATRLCGIATAEEYIALLRQYPVDLGFAKAHLFKMMHHSYELHEAQRQWLAKFNVNETDGIEELEAHVRELREAEMACGVDGPQAKTAQAEKRAAKAEVTSMLDGDEELGIVFL